ncbi:hypothetical protein PVAG01_09083 [Phlyctema vagabunda]|uniref:Nephrocystin 3-like N-terminal domain-containing protein n=1 Tax=Phlyctema vagabunda TaxID=108571 RepID=A0ABR4P6C5_9HELO
MSISTARSAPTSVRNTGITVLHEPVQSDTLADIVFVHGLQGHPRRTWTWNCADNLSASTSWDSISIESRVEKNKKHFWSRKAKGDVKTQAVQPTEPNEQNDVFWPYHLLPKDCPKARILTWGYDSEVSKFFSGAASKNNIFAHSRGLLEDLSWERRQDSTRPLIFVAHSLGGIIVKDLLLRSNESNDLKHQDLCNSTIATLFLGTPHRGSAYADIGETMRHVVTIVGFDTANQNLRALEIDSALLENCDERFQKLRDRQKLHHEVHTFQEALGMKGTQFMSLNDKVVPDFSSSFPLENSKVTINANHMTMTKYSSREDGGYRKVVRKLQEPCERLQATKNTNDQVKAFFESPQLEQGIDEVCLNTLYFPQMNTREIEIQNTREHSCSWILDNKTYAGWINQGHGVLWVKGKPGSGKSTLMKKIFQIMKQDEKDGYTYLSFFVSRRGAELQNKELGLFRTLLHQLFKRFPGVGIDFQSLFEEKQKEGRCGTAWNWTLVELRQSFESALVDAARSRPFRVFIDALDELGTEPAQKVVSYLYSLNRNLLDQGSKASICFSCRHYPIFATHEGFEICVEDENHSDISQYVYEELSTQLVTSGQDSDQLNLEIEGLQSSITDRSSGVFLWASLVVPRIIEQFNNGNSLDVVYQILESIPSAIGDVYRQILEELKSSQNISQTLQLMQIVCLAVKPLSLEQLMLAIRFEGTFDAPYPDTHSEGYRTSLMRFSQRIVSLSGGLVEVKHHEKFGVVQPIHLSVNDFLLHDEFRCLSPDATENLIGQGHARLFRSCIRYIKFLKEHATSNFFSSSEDSLDKEALYPFRKYAAYCFNHAALANEFQTFDMYIEENFIEIDHEYIRMWTRISNKYSSSERCVPDLTMLHIGAIFKLDPLVRMLIRSGTNVDQQDMAGRRAIHYAASSNDLKIIKLLVDAGSSISQVDGGGECPMNDAAGGGATEAVEYFLDLGRLPDEITLVNAVRSQNLSTVQLLLRWKAPINFERKGHGNALFCAISTTNFQIVKLLLKDYTGTFPTQCLDEALHAAAGEHNISIVETLIQHGADVNSTGGRLGSVLLEAIEALDIEVVALLIKHGADTNKQGISHCPLEFLILCSQNRMFALTESRQDSIEVAIAKLLLERAADTDLNFLNTPQGPRPLRNRAIQALINKVHPSLYHYHRNAQEEDLVDLHRAVMSDIDATRDGYPSETGSSLHDSLSGHWSLQATEPSKPFLAKSKLSKSWRRKRYVLRSVS